MIRNKKIITAIIAAIAITGNGAIPYTCFANTLDSKATVLEKNIKETNVDTNLNKENVEETYNSVAKHNSKKHNKRKNKHKNKKNTIKLMEENLLVLPEKNENSTYESALSKEIEVHKENKKEEVPNIFDLNEFPELNREQKEDNKDTVETTKVDNVETENKEDSKLINKKETEKDKIEVTENVNDDVAMPWDEGLMDEEASLMPYSPEAGDDSSWQPAPSDLDGFEISGGVNPISPIGFGEGSFLPYNEINHNTEYEMPFSDINNKPWQPTAFDLDGFEIPEEVSPISPIGFEEGGFLPYDEINHNTEYEIPFNDIYNTPWQPTVFDLDGFEIPEEVSPISPIGFEEGGFLPYDEINHNTGYETLINDIDDYMYNVNNVLNNILNDILNNIYNVNNTNDNIGTSEKVEDNKDVAILDPNIINIDNEANNKVVDNKEKAINVLDKDAKLNKKVLVNNKNNAVKMNNEKNVKKGSDNKEIKLPKTGTNSLKMLLAGIILCAIGVITRVFSKKKSSN